MTRPAPEKRNLSPDNPEKTSPLLTPWENFSLLPEPLTQVLTPGNVLFFTSFPFCYRAYRDYHQYSEMIRQSRIAASASNVPDNKLGMMVASRALGIATRGSVGFFALTGSFIFFFNGWSSLSDAVRATQTWAQSRRQRLVTILGLKDKNNEDHPDFAETKHMTDEQTLNYLAQKYFVSEEDESGRESHNEKGQ